MRSVSLLVIASVLLISVGTNVGITLSQNHEIKRTKKPDLTNGEANNRNLTDPSLPVSPAIVLKIDNHDIAIARATIVLAAVGVIQLLLLWYTYKANQRNAQAAEDSAKVARAALVTASRPRLIVRLVSVSKFEGGEPIVLQFVVVNIGGSPAHISESNVTVMATAQIDLPAIPPYSQGGNDLIGQLSFESGTSRTFTASDPGAIVPSDKSRIRDGTLRYRLIGYIQYRDDSGNIRRTAFCREKMPFQQRFITSNDPDYEYAD